MCANNCNECQGELVAPICVELDSEKYKNLDEFSVDVEKRLDAIEKPHELDIKTLSPLTDLSRDAIIQILIDEIIKLKGSSSSSTSGGTSGSGLCPGINWQNNCSSCNKDFCANLQSFINNMHLKNS